jgi:hypothetical protein
MPEAARGYASAARVVRAVALSSRALVTGWRVDIGFPTRSIDRVREHAQAECEQLPIAANSFATGGLRRQACVTRSSASGRANSRSGCLTVSTGQDAKRTTRSATLPIRRCATAPRPCVPITITSIWFAIA